MIIAALTYIMIVLFIVAIGFGFVGLSFWAVKDSITENKDKQRISYHPSRRG